MSEYVRANQRTCKKGPLIECISYVQFPEQESDRY